MQRQFDHFGGPLSAIPCIQKFRPRREIFSPQVSHPDGLPQQRRKRRAGNVPRFDWFLHGSRSVRLSVTAKIAVPGFGASALLKTSPPSRRLTCPRERTRSTISWPV